MSRRRPVRWLQPQGLRGPTGLLMPHRPWSANTLSNVVPSSGVWSRTTVFPSEVTRALARMIEAKIQWLPPTEDGALVLPWGVIQDATDPLPWPAVYLSVLFGRFSGRLRVCRQCAAVNVI